MDSHDLELIAKHSESDTELSALYADHVAFERMINKLENKSFLNATELQEVKELKKKKLAGKTRLEILLAEYRKAEAN